MTIENVKIGDTKTFVIKENSTPAPHSNLLENKEIRLTTIMGTDEKLHFTSQILRDTVTNQDEIITNDVKEQYGFDYEFVTGDDGIETLEVTIQNPIKFNVKVVKKDATGITELEGAEIEIRRGNTVVATNKETGSATVEYTEKAVKVGDNIVFTIYENSSVSPNQNILRGKTVVAYIKVNDNEKLVEDIRIVNTDVYESESVSENDFVTGSVITDENGIETLLIEIENPVDFDLDLVKNSAGVGFLNNTKFQVYREGVDEALFDSFVTDINTWRTAEVQEHNMDAGKYTYYITETKTARSRYVNVLDEKYIKVNVEVSGTGVVTIMMY